MLLTLYNRDIKVGISRIRIKNTSMISDKSVRYDVTLSKRKKQKIKDIENA